MKRKKKVKLAKSILNPIYQIIGSPEPTYTDGEYEETCKFCKMKIYLSEDWTDKKPEFMCMNCFVSGRNKKFSVDPRTAKKLGVRKKDLHMIAEEIIKNKRKERVGG